MAYAQIKVEHQDKVGVITLNAPEVLNALSADMVAELSEALDEVLAEVDLDCIEWRQLGVAVDSEEGVDLPLRSVLGGEVLDVDVDRLHLGRSNLKINYCSHR